MKTKYLLAIAVTALLFGATGSAIFSNATAQTKDAGNGQNLALTESNTPTAQKSKRVDLFTPSFSNPTKISNPLFPISDLHSVVLLGNVDGDILRVETTLLPETKIVNVNGQKIETLVSQYVAYLNGRIEEVAIDKYAQADGGSVWYLGEDISDYEHGVVSSTEGTWLAGRDGPAAMIMPANPKVGDVYRPENIPGIVFEELTVKATGVTVDGPFGPVKNAMVALELHMDGTFEDKTFAPGYGEFRSGAGGDLEALTIAVPTDAVSKSIPAELKILSTGAAKILNSAESGNWNDASGMLKQMNSAWTSFEKQNVVPGLLKAQMDRALEALAGDAIVPAVDGHNAVGASKAAIDVAQASLDLQLRYVPTTDIDFARFELWVHQLIVDAKAEEPDAVKGDVTTLGWIRDRFAHTLNDDNVKKIDGKLGDLRVAADGEALEDAARTAGQLLATIKQMQ